MIEGYSNNYPHLFLKQQVGIVLMGIRVFFYFPALYLAKNFF